MSDQRKRRRVIIAAVALTAAALAMPAWGLVAPREPVPASSVVAGNRDQDSDSAEFTMYPDRDSGIEMSVYRTYTEDTELTEATLLVTGEPGTRPEYFRSVDADNDGLDLFNVDIPAGTGVNVAARVMPDCEHPNFTPDITFSLPGKLAGRREFVDVVRPSNLDAYANVLRRYCLIGLQVSVSGNTSAAPGGLAVGTIGVWNGTDDPVTLTVPRYSVGSTRWEPTSKDTKSIPPHEVGYLPLKGTNVGCDPDQDVPWSPERLQLRGPDQTPTVTVNWYWCE